MGQNSWLLNAITFGVYPPQSGGGGGGVTPSQVQKFSFNFQPATGVNDAFVVNLNPPVVSLTDGLIVTMSSGDLQNDTDSPTLKLNALPAKPIVLWAGSLAPGDIQTNASYLFQYNLAEDHFQLLNPSVSTANTFLVQSNFYNAAVDTGTVNAYEVTIVPNPDSAISVGFPVHVQVGSTNTGSCTLTVNGDTYDVVMIDGQQVPSDSIIANSIASFMFSTGFDAFVLMNPSILTPSNPNFSYTGSIISAAFMTFYTASGIQAGVYVPSFIAATYVDQLAEPNILTLNLGTVGQIDNSFDPVMAGLTSFTANSLVMEVINFSPVFNAVTTMSVPALKTVANTLGGSYNSLTTYPFTAVDFVGMDYTPSFAVLTSMTTGVLARVVGNYAPTIPLVTSLAESALASVASLTLNSNNLASISLPALTTTTTGVFSITSSGLTTLTLTLLATVAGAFTVSAASLTTLSTPALTTSGAMTITADSLTTFNMPNLATLTSFSIAAAALTSLSLPGVTTCGAISVTSAAMTSLSFANLATVVGALTINASSLTTLSLPLLTSRTSSNFSGTMAAITTMSFPELITEQGFAFVANSLTTFSIPKLVSSSFTFTATSLTTISAPLMTTCSTIAPVAPALITLSLPSLVGTTAVTLTANGLATINLANVTALSALTVVSSGLTSLVLTNLTNLSLGTNLNLASITSISFPAIQRACITNSATNNITIVAPNLTSFSFGSGLLQCSNGAVAGQGNVIITGAALDQTSVDNILVRLAALTGTGGTTAYSNRTVNLSGGTSATPSATGLTAKSALQGRGCTVTTN